MLWQRVSILRKRSIVYTSDYGVILTMDAAQLKQTKHDWQVLNFIPNDDPPRDFRARSQRARWSENRIRKKSLHIASTSAYVGWSLILIWSNSDTASLLPVLPR